jgi:hypothetical protein
VERSTRVWCEGWTRWQYLEDALFEGALAGGGAGGAHALDELLEDVLPADSLLEVGGAQHNPSLMRSRAKVQTPLRGSYRRLLVAVAHPPPRAHPVAPCARSVS